MFHCLSLMNKTGVRRCFVHKSLASLVQRLLLKTQAAKGKAHKGCCHGSLSKLPRFLRSSRSTPPGTRRPRTAVRHREPLRALLWHVRCRPATSLNLNDAGPAGPALLGNLHRNLWQLPELGHRLSWRWIKPGAEHAPGRALRFFRSSWSSQVSRPQRSDDRAKPGLRRASQV